MMATRRFQKLFLALGALGFAATAACGDELPTGLVIVGNAVPDDSCLVKATAGGGGQQQLRSAGTLDVSVGNQYYMALLVQNSMPQLGALAGFDDEDARLDAGTVRLESIQVELEMSSAILTGAEFVTRLTELGVALNDPTRISYSRPAAANVVPGGVGVQIAEVVPGNIGRALRAIPELSLPDTQIEVLVRVKAVGRRLDGVKVKSAEFVYPISICNNCRVSHVFDDAVARDPFNPNIGEGAPEADQISDACVPGADDFVSNAFCGAMWGPSTGGGGDQCKLDRCLGASAAGASLVCPNDGASFAADFTPAAPAAQ
jgi:hypothetical protein